MASTLPFWSHDSIAPSPRSFCRARAKPLPKREQRAKKCFTFPELLNCLSRRKSWLSAAILMPSLRWARCLSMPARHRSRQRALQILFLWDQRKQDVGEAISSFYETLGMDEEDPKP